MPVLAGGGEKEVKSVRRGAGTTNPNPPEGGPSWSAHSAIIPNRLDLERHAERCALTDRGGWPLL